MDLPCPDADWKRFSALLDAALELPDEDRAGWLAALAGADARLRPWLDRVLGNGTGIETGFALSAAACEAAPEEAFHPGDTVGPWRLEARLGSGGMGEVWRAARDEEGPRRDVALKIPYPDYLSGPFRQRFARERDVLASLSHPNIAVLYDAGVTGSGTPWLALELVDGQPITEACRLGALPLERRIALAVAVLDALSYAHQRLIVHRDIKPSNVMVTREGVVKLLDFGIAKLLGTDEIALTQRAARLATPAYAAPEQMQGGAITVATDIYSAGVLLFEMCTGSRPKPTQDDIPPLASAAADRDMARRLRGDLDAVLARAMMPEAAARYGSAEAFAADLRRWRGGHPVQARRIGRIARARKFVARNRASVGLGAVLAASVVIGTAGVAWQAQRTAQQAARATAVNDFLLSLFEANDPRTGAERDHLPTARDLLDRGAQRADTAFAHDPATAITLLDTLAQLYDFLGERERAEPLLVRRLRLARKLYGDENPAVLTSAIELASLETSELRIDEAKATLAGVRAAVLRGQGAESLTWAMWLEIRARVLRGTPGARSEAIADARESARIYDAHYRTDAEFPWVLDLLALLQLGQEQDADALATLQRMREANAQLPRPDAIVEMAYAYEAGMALKRLGRRPEADASLARAQRLAEKLQGRQSEWYTRAAVFRALMQHTKGDRAQADAAFGHLLESAGGSEIVRCIYGEALVQEGRGAAAVAFLEPSLAAYRHASRDEYNVRELELLIGEAYEQAGRSAEARQMIKAARDDFVRYGVPDGTRTLGAQVRWARFLAAHGEGEAAAAEFHAVLAASAMRPSAPAALAWSGLARLALARGDLPAADLLSARAITVLAAVPVEYDVRAWLRVWGARAEVLLAMKDRTRAHDFAEKAAALADHSCAPGSAAVARAEDVLRRTAPDAPDERRVGAVAMGMEPP